MASDPGFDRVVHRGYRLSLVDQRRHGYCVLELEAAEARVSFRHVAAREDPVSPISTNYRFRVPRGRSVVEPV